MRCQILLATMQENSFSNRSIENTGRADYTRLRGYSRALCPGRAGVQRPSALHPSGAGEDNTRIPVIVGYSSSLSPKLAYQRYSLGTRAIVTLGTAKSSKGPSAGFVEDGTTTSRVGVAVDFPAKHRSGSFDYLVYGEYRDQKFRCGSPGSDIWTLTFARFSHSAIVVKVKAVQAKHCKKLAAHTTWTTESQK